MNNIKAHYLTSYKTKMQLQLENSELILCNKEIRYELQKQIQDNNNISNELMYIKTNHIIQSNNYMELQCKYNKLEGLYNKLVHMHKILEEEYNILNKMHENLVLSYHQIKTNVNKQNSTNLQNNALPQLSSDSDDDYEKIEYF